MDRRTFAKLVGLSGLGAISSRPGRAASSLLQDTFHSSSSSATSAWDVYRLGTSYYPEWWEASEWETDFAQMQGLGLTGGGRSVSSIRLEPLGVAVLASAKTS